VRQHGAFTQGHKWEVKKFSSSFFSNSFCFSVGEIIMPGNVKKKKEKKKVIRDPVFNGNDNYVKHGEN
jgi:hypothetical protein